MLAGGIAYNINWRYFYLGIGLEVWSLAFLQGTVKIPIQLISNVSIYPRLGAGISIFGSLVIAGAGIKYSISDNHALLIEVNQSFINAPKIWLGSPDVRKNNLKEFPPLSILIGIEL